ncbi:MAG TPA: hypothetical protein VMT58_00865, partial [Candidatus Binataceae bacterium]|nr:hypothetical protein [Candidatus Binataceae bacterium]
AVDPSGNAYVTGLAASENFPVTENAFIPYPDFDCSAAFLTELNPTGSAEIYSTYLYGGYEEDCSYDGGNPLDFYFTQFGSSVALDGANDVYIGGRTDSYEFPATSNDQCYCQGYPYTCCTGYGTGTCSTIQEYFGGDNDGFLTEFAVSPPGSYAPLNVAMSTFLGGEYYDGVFGVALDPSGSVYLTGDSASVDFPTTASAFQTGLDGRQNAFVAKIGCLPKGTAQIFAGNSYDPNNGSTIQIFGNQSNCDSSPQSFLYGDKTGLNYPFGLAYSTIAGSIESTPPFLYVVNYGGASVSYFSHYKYSEAQWSGDGNHHPDGTISGPDTGLAGAMGIAVDNSTGNVYVANSAGGSDFSGSITVYTNAQIASIPFAGSADLVPVAVIAGTNTGLNSPLGVAVDPATGNIYVANNAGPNGTGGDGSVTEYSLAQITAIIGGANGNVTPVETIFGPLTGLSQPSAIAIDGDSNVYVANNSGDAIGPLASGSITIYSQGAITGGLSNAGFLFPNSDAIPNATIIGPPSGPNYTLLNDAVGLAVDANGLIYVSNFGQTGSVTVYPSLTNLGSQANYPNVAPVANITGPDTGLYGPRGLAVDPPPARTRRQRRRKKHRH